MKIKNLIVVAALLLGSTSAFAQATPTASGLFKITVDGSGNATITGFRADLPASDQMNVTVPATLTNDGGADYNVIAIGANAFESNANLKTISIAASVATIDDEAFSDCSQLTTVTFAENSELATLGDNVFGDTPGLTKISFANCAKMKDFSGVVPFVNASNENYYLKEIEFNAATTNIGTALAGLKGLTTVNLDKTAITGLAVGSLAGTDALTTLVLPATCTSILGTSAAALTSLTINAKDVNLATGSFDLADANSTVTFAEIDGATIANNAIVSNSTGAKAATLVIGDIKSGLTANVIVSGQVGSVTVGAIGGGSAPITVNTGAFGAAKSISFGEIKTNGSIVGTDADEVESLASVTFTKPIVIGGVGASAFAKYTKLATVTFQGKLAAGAAGSAVDAGAFYGNKADHSTAIYAGSAADAAPITGIKMTVTYLPADEDVDDTYSPFDDFAFAENGYETGGGTKVVELVTTRTQGLALQTLVATFERVNLSFAPEEKTIEVAKKDGKYWYGTYINNSMLKIAKEQNGDKVMVYGAYVDQEDNTIYMDQLHVIKGYYFVPANCPVIIKSNTADPVKAEAPTTLELASLPTVTIGMTTYNVGSMNLKDGSNYQNEICVSQKADNTAAKIMNKGADIDWTDVTGAATVNNNDFAIFFLYPAKSFNFYWNSIVATGSVPEGTFYIRVNKSKIAAGGRVNIVWNDGSEEATAIQTVKKVAEANGAIYNLAGQKVNASYKGVVIKDGKKYIQK